MATDQSKAGVSGRGQVFDRLNRSSDFGKHEGAQWFFLGLLSLVRRINYDPVLLFFLMLIAAIGLVAGYSASDQSVVWVEKSAFRFALAFLLMLAIAQVPQRFFFAVVVWVRCFAAGGSASVRGCREGGATVVGLGVHPLPTRRNSKTRHADDAGLVPGQETAASAIPGCGDCPDSGGGAHGLDCDAA